MGGSLGGVEGGGPGVKVPKSYFEKLSHHFRQFVTFFNFYDFPTKPKIGGGPRGGGGGTLSFIIVLVLLLLVLLRRNTVVALASAGISVGLASWGLARLTDNHTLLTISMVFIRILVSIPSI